jgi:hypothetical protein
MMMMILGVMRYSLMDALSFGGVREVTEELGVWFGANGEGFDID